MKYILGTKQHMTQYFTEEGKCIPGTIIQAGPLVVTQVKTRERDGYTAVQVGYKTTDESRLPKAQKGHLSAVKAQAGTKDLGTFAILKEFRVPEAEIENYSIGDPIDISAFEAGETVTVRGTTKAKGFQGVVKRHDFGGGPRTHGNKHHERAPGAIGATGPQRVFKNTKMGGRMGNDKVTVKNLTVLAVDTDTNALLVKGAVPGSPGSLVSIEAGGLPAQDAQAGTSAAQNA